MVFLIPYPVIDPVLVTIGPFPIRWYALAYVFGLLLGWLYARWIVGRGALWAAAAARPTAQSLDDLLVYTALGVILGGRAVYVLVYNFGYYSLHPLEIFVLWRGGMSFHGGLLGAGLAIWVFARRHHVPVLTVGDVASAVAPVGLFLGRLANFIKPELWGRPADVPWAMVFPGAGPLPRHPSQLYEAALEGVVLLILLHVLMRVGALRKPGLTTGVFAAGYGCARVTCEFFREPDAQLGFLFGDATMGMLLSVPLIVFGLVLIVLSRRPARAAA